MAMQDPFQMFAESDLEMDRLPTASLGDELVCSLGVVVIYAYILERRHSLRDFH
jgi:hypothetical protein